MEGIVAVRAPQGKNAGREQQARCDRLMMGSGPQQRECHKAGRWAGNNKVGVTLQEGGQATTD